MTRLSTPLHSFLVLAYFEMRYHKMRKQEDGISLQKLHVIMWRSRLYDTLCLCCSSENGTDIWNELSDIKSEPHLSTSKPKRFQQRVLNPPGSASATDPFATPRSSALSHVHHHTWRRWKELPGIEKNQGTQNILMALTLNRAWYPLVMTNMAIENGHLWWDLPFKMMVMFHGYV